MAQLADAIQYVTAKEIEKNEAELASCFPPQAELSQHDQANLVPFAQWCEEQRVRCLPAQPATIAAYLRYVADLKVPHEKILKTVSAIEALHNAAGIANPIATNLVRGMLEAITDIRPPRSWTKEEKTSFVQLPPDIREAISRREEDRERTFRRKQNELAELIKEAKQPTDSAKPEPVIIQEEKVITNGKERRISE